MARSRPNTIGNVRRPCFSSFRISRILLVSMMDPTNRVAGSAGIRNASESSRVHAKPVMRTIAKPMAIPDEISPNGVREIGFGPPEYKKLIKIQMMPAGMYHHVMVADRYRPMMIGTIIRTLIIVEMSFGVTAPRVREPALPIFCPASRPDLKSFNSFHKLAMI